MRLSGAISLRFSTINHPLLTFTLLIVAVLLIYYFPFLSGRADFYWGDHRSFFEPFCTFIGAAFRKGYLPLWNPYVGCGQSQLAIASPAIFYPPHLLFAVMPYSRCVAVQMLLNQTVTAVGMFVLVERWGWGRIAAAIAACTLALSGYMFALSANFTLVSTASWVPLSIYFLLLARGNTSKEKLIGLFGGSATVALLLIAGRPEIWVPAIVALAAVAVAPLVSHKFNSQGWMLFLLSIIPLSLGVLLAMPALLPVAEWARISPRTRVDVVSALNFSGSWYDFLNVVFPSPLGPIDHMNNPALRLVESRTGYLPFCPNVFLGPVVVTLSLIGLLDKSWRWRWWPLLLFLLATLAIAGANLPAAPFVLSELPILALFRYPAKLMFYLDLALAIMAARGVNFVLGQRQELRRPVLWIAAMWCLCVATGAALYCQPSLSWFGFQQFLKQYAGAAAPDVLRSLSTSVMLTGIAGFALAAAALAFCRRQRFLFVCVWLSFLPVTLIANAFAFTRFTTDPGFFTSPGLVSDVSIVIM